MRARAALAALAAVLLSGCGGGSASGPAVDTAVAVNDATGATPARTASVESSDTTPVRSASVSRLKPFDAYVVLGGDIKRCWFNANKPLLPDYVYRADVPADGSKVQITVHKKIELGRAGTSTYAIDLKQEGVSTIVTTENRKMPPEIAERMQADINRWKMGDATCSSGWPKVTADSSPAATPKPQ
jgi:hypothetical protein